MIIRDRIDMLCMAYERIGDNYRCVYMRSNLKRNRANMFSAFGLHRQVSW